MNRIEIQLDPNGNNMNGSVGYISWNRLESMFRQRGEMKAGEQLVRVRVDDNGITYRVEEKP